VRDSFELPHATDTQLARIEETLRSLELERAEQISAKRAYSAYSAPVPRSGGDDLRGGVPLRGRRTRGARWVRRRGPDALASASGADAALDHR
jgi:hypothetical protein